AMNRGMRRSAGFGGQRGISLVIVLVLLVATSILAIAVLRSSSMQERMSANLRDRSLAFQGAEAALRYAQEQVLASGACDTEIPSAPNCVPGLNVCPTGPDPGGSDVRAEAFDFDDAGWAAAPQYWIESLGTGPGRKGACDV